MLVLNSDKPLQVEIKCSIDSGSDSGLSIQKRQKGELKTNHVKNVAHMLF